MYSKMTQFSKPAKFRGRNLDQSIGSVRLVPSLTGRSKALKPKARKGSSSNKTKRVNYVRKFETDNVRNLVCMLSTDLHCYSDQPVTSDLSLEKVESLMLLRSFLKKFEDFPSQEADNMAVEGFLQRNTDCATYRLEPKELFDDVIIEEVRSILHSAIYPSYDSTFSLSNISEGFNVGPGASLDSESEDFLTKVFHSGLSRTNEDLYSFYVHAIRGSTWAEAEKQRSAEYEPSIVVGSRLSCVPKNVDISRVICTEPVLNMLFQKGIGRHLELCLKRSFGIDISKQPEINREMARIGSIDGSFGTIDLAGASDSISVSLCESILPPILHWWLMLSRSPYTTLPTGDTVKLNMISSMGNAFTFPLQTMIFASIVKACYRTLGVKSERCDQLKPNFSVFGDDIIVRSDAYNLVCRTLKLFGFTVNDGKSFNSGTFRESCGGDFWRGYQVRGVYIRSLSRECDIFSSVNRLIRWSCRSGVDLKFTIMYLLTHLKRVFHVPYVAGDTEGIKVPHSLSNFQYFSLSTRSALYKALVPKIQSYTVPSEGSVWKIKDGHRRSYNASAILTSFIGGYVRDGRVTRRSTSKTMNHKVRMRSVPFWDYIPLADDVNRQGNSWLTVSARHLCNEASA